MATKYGTAEEYADCIRALRRAGLLVLADVVLNHRLGADEPERVRVRPVDPGNRLAPPGQAQEAEVYTRFTFPGRKDRYSPFVWDHRRFTGVDTSAQGQQRSLFLLDGKQWAADVDGENGNFDYLMGADVDVCDAEVGAELRRWGLWFLKKSGADGFRLDAVKHISASFLAGWLSALREATGRELFAVGEYWNYDCSALEAFLSRTGNCMSLFDVPLHGHFREASHSGGTYDMRGLFADTLTDSRPELSVTFVDNHDTQPGQSLESWVDGWFKAAAYGFIEGYQGELTDAEIENLVFAGILITFENGVRFLTDYLNGDVYFKIRYPQHNLDRARNQFKLVQEMQSHYEELDALVRNARADVEGILQQAGSTCF